MGIIFHKDVPVSVHAVLTRLIMDNGAAAAANRATVVEPHKGGYQTPDGNRYERYYLVRLYYGSVFLCCIAIANVDGCLTTISHIPHTRPY